MARDEPRLFSALLRHWRTRRGMSQLDLALAADVSARHVSFLETGRAQPSREMILALASSLDVSLRDQNVLLQSAGFPGEFGERTLAQGMPPAIQRAIERMFAQQEPFPMMALSRACDVLRANRATTRVLGRFVLDRAAMTDPPNAMRMIFDPRLARPFVVDWERTARSLLSRLHRDSLTGPSDASSSAQGALVRALLEYPDVPAVFRQPDFGESVEPVFSFRLRRDGLELAFLTTMTAFNAPQDVTLDELLLESYFPLDDATAQACERLAAADP
jgi:transcriptional regulator with XRE-family HTH domain